MNLLVPSQTFPMPPYDFNLYGGIAMLSVDKFNVCAEANKVQRIYFMLKRYLSRSKTFPQLKNPSYQLVIPPIWLKSSYKHGVTRSLRSGDESGRPRVGIAIVTSSLAFLSLYISRWWRQTWDTWLYPTLGCDIQGFRAMGFSVQYWPRWYQDFPAIRLADPLGANRAHLGICTFPEKSFSCMK